MIEDETSSVVVATPTRFGLPHVPSDRRRCDRCRADVWLSQRARGWLGGVLCVVCAMAVVKPTDTIAPAPWALEELELGET